MYEVCNLEWFLSVLTFNLFIVDLPNVYECVYWRRSMEMNQNVFDSSVGPIAPLPHFWPVCRVCLCAPCDCAQDLNL